MLYQISRFLIFWSVSYSFALHATDCIGVGRDLVSNNSCYIKSATDVFQLSIVKNQVGDAINYNRCAQAKKKGNVGVFLSNVGSSALLSENNIKNAVSTIKKSSVNEVYPVVWNKGQLSFYTNNPLIKKYLGNFEMVKDLDIMDNVVEQAHSGKKKLSVTAWFEYGLKSTPSSYVFKKHPELFTKDIDNHYASKEDPTHVYMNPFKTESKTLLKTIIKELISNYDIDGIVFDDHFSLPSNFGYDEDTIKLYYQETGKKMPSANHPILRSLVAMDPEWTSWRMNKISSLMKEICHEIKNARPDMKIVLAPNHASNARKYLQDWPSWVKEGLIDEINMQVYRTNERDFSNVMNNFGLPEKDMNCVAVNVIISGNSYGKKLPLSQVKRQVQLAKEKGLNGYALFPFETFKHNLPSH